MRRVRKPIMCRNLKGSRNTLQRLAAAAAGCGSAYLTVFLALSLPVILSLFFLLLYGARMGAVRMQIEVVADTATDSVLAEFHKELLKQYDLLMIDTSYGTDEPSISNTENHLETYMEQNFSATDGSISDFTGLSLTSLSINETRFAADNDCEALREQIYAYIAAEPVGELTAQILASVDTFNGLGLDTSRWSSLKSENEEAVKEGIAKALSSSQEETSDDGTTDDESADLVEAQDYVESQGVSASDAINIYNTLDQMLTLSVLTQMFGSTSSLSQAETDTSGVLSGRDIHIGDGLQPENSHAYEEADTITFDIYAFEKCGSYARPLDKSVLKYQLEYLLYGKDSDLSNLEKTAETLLLIRLAANLIAIYQDSGRQAQAKTWGTVIAALLMSPSLESVFTTAILLIWTYMESLQDVRTLLEGGSVPLIKSSSEWKTGLTSIFSGTISSSGNDSGLDYESYLHILLFLASGSTKNYRLMDLMEMDIRATEGNENFQIDWCMDAFTMEAAVSSSYGYSYTITREATYN